MRVVNVCHEHEKVCCMVNTSEFAHFQQLKALLEAEAARRRALERDLPDAAKNDFEKIKVRHVKFGTLIIVVLLRQEI